MLIPISHIKVITVATDSLEALLKIWKRNILRLIDLLISSTFSSMTFLPQFVLYESSVVEDSKYSYAIHTYKFKDWRGVTTLKNQKK